MRSEALALVAALAIGAGAGTPLSRLAGRLSAARPPPWPLMSAAGGVAAITALLMRPAAQLGFALPLGCGLLVLAAVDLAVLRLPDIITLPLGILGALDSIFGPATLAERLLGWAVGLAVLAGLEEAYRRLRGRSGLGLGDAKLFAAAGAWVGVQGLAEVLELACGAGLVFVALRLLREGKRALSAPLPFGVFLAAALWLVWLGV